MVFSGLIRIRLSKYIYLNQPLRKKPQSFQVAFKPERPKSTTILIVRAYLFQPLRKKTPERFRYNAKMVKKKFGSAEKAEQIDKLSNCRGAKRCSVFEATDTKAERLVAVVPEHHAAAIAQASAPCVRT